MGVVLRLRGVRPQPQRPIATTIRTGQADSLSRTNCRDGPERHPSLPERVVHAAGRGAGPGRSCPPSLPRSGLASSGLNADTVFRPIMF
jgi:hypothetical protein